MRTQPSPRAIFDKAVYAICRAIPRGKVMTYGDIAAFIPPPPGMDPLGYDRIKARWVGYALASCPEDVPWYRVVNSRGQISSRPTSPLQQALLEEEGVRFKTPGRLALAAYRWSPTAADLEAAAQGIQES